ncbi:MAG: YfiR family protein, partial [Azonexus sp.]|uniref:YfiR family protein n=1 Tax=Azonexus sp. TaxID=1872668 RepID=UPI00282A4AA7
NLTQATNHPVSVRNLTGDEASWATDCDVLYIGGVTPALRSKLLAEAVGKPALTISEGDSVCAEPSMFCLAVQGSEVGLLANLDAISRSGIRISPKVLQLVRRRQGGG